MKSSALSPYLSCICNARAVAINPALTPSKSLYKHREDVSAEADYRQLEASAAAKTDLPSRVVVIGMSDDVGDPRTNGLLLKEETQTVLLDMGNQIELPYYAMIAGLVRQLAVTARPA
jgi:predicted esterase YcpF (UPF0227 family)